MRRFYEFWIHTFLSLALAVRYRVKVKGLEKLTPEALNKPGGILFLANHPAEIDPAILLRVLWFKFRPHPVAVEYLFQIPFIRYLLKKAGAVPIPNFSDSSNSFKRRLINQTFGNLDEMLRKGENLLIYPAGSLKQSAEEFLGGASGVHKILGDCPDANVVLIRTTGLWGSSFSRALTGKSPHVLKVLLHGVRVAFRNLLFFTPKREVVVELEPAGADFPYAAERRAFNEYLENWYNAPGVESLKLVSYSVYSDDFPKVKAIEAEKEICIEKVSEEVKESVLEEIASLAGKKKGEIDPEANLARDLGFDSLDIAQVVVFLKENHGVASLHSTDLTTVGSVMAYAAHLIKGGDVDEEEPTFATWPVEKERPPVQYPTEVETLIEAFLRTCDRMGGHTACVDALSGELSYHKMKMGVFLLAEKISKLPGENIGIMMPASVAVNVVILATLLAGKVPVMINWTLGPRNLTTVVEQSKLQVTLSSWKFIDRLDNVNLNGIDETIVLLEDVRREISLLDKVRAVRWAQKKAPAILRHFGADKLTKENTAVILFTSGTESLPKGVPLTHANLIANQSEALGYVNLTCDDVLFGVLPPFHSFGFSVTGIFPLIAGMRVAYAPNPTDGRRMAEAIERWKVTMLCIAPTFLRTLFRVATPKQMTTLRLVVTGAEKTPADMFEKINELNGEAQLLEGYGITECGPILTLNPLDAPTNGVGKPLPSVELLIVHPETHEVQSVGDSGLILARGPNVFGGYLDSNLSKPFVEVEGKEWYSTGDLGYLDERSYLTLSGRLKRFVKIGGEMISLGAVEDAILTAAKTTGWPIEGEMPTFAVCSTEGEGKKSEIHLFTTFEVAVDEVNKELRAGGMSNLVKIAAVHKVPAIPLLGTGKIDYRRLTAKLS